jgi:two-component system cell cycle response regulator
MEDDGVPDCDPDSQDPAASRPTTPAIPAAVRAPAAPRHDTPVLPFPVQPRPYPVRIARATLTLLTGVDAGRLLAVEAAEVIVGRAVDANLVVEDAGVSRRHARVARTSDGGFYVEDLGSTNGTFVGSDRVGISLLQGGETVQLGPQLRIRFAIIEAAEESAHRRLYDASIHDALTHLYNSKYLADRLVAEVARARRSGGELALLRADVDFLMKVNDRFGRAAGDRALCIVGARMKRAVRVEDVLARYGGNEFAIIAPGTGDIEALHLGERARRAVEGLHMSAQGEAVPITLSIGVASLAEVSASADSIAELLGLADYRLCCAKAAGRNRVCAAGSSS